MLRSTDWAPIYFFQFCFAASVTLILTLDRFLLLCSAGLILFFHCFFFLFFQVVVDNSNLEAFSAYWLSFILVLGMHGCAGLLGGCNLHSHCKSLRGG